MYSTNHALISLAVASVLSLNPAMALGLGILSHFLVDILPHGDTPPDYRKFGNRFQPAPPGMGQENRGMVTALIDSLILIGIVLFLFFSNRVGNANVFIAAIIGGILPDIAWGGITVFKIHWLNGFNRVHHCIHNLLPFDWSYGVGLALQGLLAVVLLSLLYF